MSINHEMGATSIIDLSQLWGEQSAPFPGQTGPSIVWERRLSSDRVNVQRVTSTMHVGTHLDAPLHFMSAGGDIASIGFDRLYGPAIVADISGLVSDYEVFTPEMVASAVDVQPGDMLFIHTGYHRFAPYGDSPDEERYFCRHPGPDRKFGQWCLSQELRLLGIDTSSMDHPMNTSIRKLRPDLAKEAELVLGSPLDDLFPSSVFQCMHRDLFPHGLVHVENLGGDIRQILNQRMTVGVFPSRFKGGEAAMCRVVAFVKLR
jgi:kynurenine formamidase